MAEELNLSEQDLSVESTDLGEESNISTDLSFMNSSDDALYAKPEAIDIYKNSVGNPVTGSNPAAKVSGVNNVDAINSIVNNSVKKSQTSVNPYARMKPFTYSGDYDGANFQRYYSTKAYDTLGFSPYRDNESLYNSNMTLGDDFVRAASQWDNLVATGFKSGIKAWGTLFTDPLAPDIESAREMERAMAIGRSGKGGLGGFAVNTFLNSAYTIGIAADFLAEELALAAATAFTGGFAGEVTVPGMAAKAGATARRLAGLGEAGVNINKNAERIKTALQGEKNIGQISGSVDEVFTGVNGARSFYNKAISGAFDILNPLENTVAAFRKTDYASDLAKTLGRSGAFIDDIIQIKTAVSEAKLEGGMVKINATKELIDQYRSTHGGADPEGEDLANIEKLASDEARRTAFWNLPAIMTSNKLLYSTMMLPIAKMVGRAGNRSVRLIEDIAAEKGMKALVTDPFKVIGKSSREQLRAAAKSFRNPKLYGTYGMTYLKANFAEGIQENIQEAISQGAIDHALAVQRDPRMAAYQGYMGHFMKGLEDQISAQGFETFAGGFAMGMFVQPVMSVPAWSAAKISDIFKNKEKLNEAKAERDRILNDQTKVLNDLANKDVLMWAPDLGTAVRNGALSDDLQHAASIGDHSSAKSIKDTITFNHIATAINTGKFDLLMDKLKDYKNLTPAEALEAFKKYDIGINTEEDAVKALGYFDKVIDRAYNIKDEYENVAQNFPNPHDFTKYKADTPEFKASLASYHAWQEAQKNLVFANSTFKSYGNRIKSMANSFSEIANGIAQSEAQSLMSVLSLSNLQTELFTLKNEIKTLGEVPEQASVKRDKEKTLELLQNFYDSIKEAQETISKNPTLSYLDKQLIYSQAKKDFQKYLQYLSKKNDTILFNTTTDKAFSLLTDTLEMKNDMQGLARSINVLSDPTGFFNLQTRIANALSEDRLNRLDTITKNLDRFMTMKDEAVILQELGKEGLKLPEDFLQAYKKALENGETLPDPEYFIDPETGLQINPSTEPEKYTIASDLWLTFAEWIQMNTKVKPKETVVKKEETEVFDEKDFNSFSEDLKAELTELYNNYKAEGLIPEGQTIEEFIKDNPIAINKIAKAKAGEKVKKEAIKTQSFEEYKNLTISELNSRLKDVLKEEVKDPSVAPERKKIEDALNYKIRSEIKLTDAQQKALDEIDKLKKVVKNKDNEKNPYIVEGDRKDLRATQLVDVILENEFPTYKKFYYAYTKEGTPNELLALYNKLAADESLKNDNPAIEAKNIMTEFKKQAVGLQDFESRFNDRKLNAMEKRLAKAPMTEKEFGDLIDEYVYEETSIRGNTLDKFGRDFFEGKELKPENYNMTEKAFEQARQIFIKFNKEIAEKGEIILSNGLIVWGTSKYTIDGKPQTFGGEMDLLVVTPKGEFKIYDMKTANNWANFGVDKVTEEGEVIKEEYHKKDRYSLQLGIYKNATENLTSIPVTSLNLLPIQTRQDLDGRITNVVEADAVKNKVIDYGDVKPVLDKYVPSKLEQDIQPTEEPTPTPTEEDVPVEEVETEVEEEVVPQKPAPISAKDIIEDKPVTDEIDEAILANKRSKVEYGDMFSVGRRKARYNSKTNQWEFFTTKGKLITSNSLIKQLSYELSKKTGIVNIWWTTLLSNKQRAIALDYFDRLHDLYMRGFSMSKEDFSSSPYVLTLEYLYNIKFKLKGDVDKNTTNVNKKVWFSEDGLSLDKFIEGLLEYLELYGAKDQSLDDLDYRNVVYDFVNLYPNGIKNKDIKEYIDDTNPNKELLDLNDKFINEFGLSIEVTFNKLYELKKLDYEKSINSNITNEGLTGGEEDLGELESLEERTREEEEFERQVNNAYKGTLVFLSPGSGKSSFSSAFSDVIDADVLAFSVIKELDPKFDLTGYSHPGKAIYDFIVYSDKKVPKEEFYKMVYDKAQVYMNMGKTVVTGSSNLMQYADYVFIQENKIINELRAKTGYNVQNELKKANEINKPYIVINDYANAVLKKSPEELKAITPEIFKYPQKPSDIEEDTSKQLSKEINFQNLTTAMQKNYDVLYKNNRYAIANVQENTVSLTDPQGNTITVNHDQITSIEDSKVEKSQGSDIDQTKDNIKSIVGLKIKLTPGISKQDALNNIKKKKC